MQCHGHLGKDFAAHIAKLLDAFCKEVLRQACKAMAASGKDFAGPYASSIARLLEDNDKDIRRQACKAMAALGTDFAAPYALNIAKLLKDSNEEVRMALSELVHEILDKETDKEVHDASKLRLPQATLLFVEPVQTFIHIKAQGERVLRRVSSDSDVLAPKARDPLPSRIK